uniref:TOG domain-containing protein n=2 Tax=Mesocestoides corti TaxID=53468 RepID=A0A5K3FJM5_MESCO
MDVLQNRGLYTASLLFGFVPVELYLRVSGNDDFQQKLTAFSQLRVLLTTFLKNVTLLMDHVPDNDDSHFLELTAHMASFVTLLRRLLRVDNIEVLENCFSLLMVLTSGLPASVINSIKEFLIAAIFQRLDSQHENVRKSIQILSSMLCKRLPVHLVIEFVNLQINCQCASTKRKLIDVLTTIILENRTIPKKPKPLLWKLAQLMLDCEIQVRIAALECLAAIFSLMSLSVTDFVNNIATNFPPSIDVCTKKKILRCIKERIKVNEPPKLRPDGLLEYNLNDLKAKTSELPITAGLRTKKDCNSNVNATYNEISRSPPRIYPRRTALQRNRRPNCSYLDHFSALQKFQNISRPCQASRAALTRSTDEETGTSIPLRKSTSFINESTEKVTQNTYAFITRKKSTKENKSNFMEWNSVPSCSFDTSEEIGGSVVLRRCHSALSTEDRDYEGLVSLSQIAESIMSIKCSASKRLDSLRSRISRSKNCEGQPTERQPLKALVLLEKTQAWAQKSQALFTQTNVHQNYAGDVTEIVTKESRETSTRMSSGYASEDVNQAVSVLPHDEVITGKNTNATFSNPWQPMIPVSAIGTHIRPRLRKTKLTSPMRSRTVHWASRPFHAVDRDAISSVDDLTSTNWQDQHCALQCLSGFLRSDVPSQEHELRKWSPGKIQQLCSGLVFTTSSLRSQISRMAITIIKSTIRQLSPSQLEPVTMKLFFGLISRVGGDASSSFLRTEACEAISLLVSQASPFIIVTCLNDACHSIQARSVAGRRCLAHCYASVLPRLLPPKASLSKASDKPIGTGKRKDIFDKILFHVVSFLRDGDLETRLLRRLSSRLMASGTKGDCAASLHLTVVLQWAKCIYPCVKPIHPGDRTGIKVSCLFMSLELGY